MTKQEIIELSVEVTTEYYKNNTAPFLDCLDKKAQWYGPAQGQFLIGRDAIRAAYKAEPVHSLSFTMENIQVNAISTSPSFCEVMLRFYVTTRYPDGKSFRHFQRIHLTWCMHRIKAADGTRSFIPKILMCSITNPHPKHSEDNIYPTHYESSYWNQSTEKGDRQLMNFHAADGSDYYLTSFDIKWIESTGNSRHSVLHTTVDTVEVMTTTATIERNCPDAFLRCHSSYLVNPFYVILIPNKKQTIFAVYFPQYCVVVLARRQPCRVLRLVLRKISSQTISLLSIRN